jgi:hypothetical protein
MTKPLKAVAGALAVALALLIVAWIFYVSVGAD